MQHRLGSGNRLPRLGAVLHHLINNHQIELNLRLGAQSVGILHGHFYNSHLRPQDVEVHIAQTQRFIANLLDVYEHHSSQS